MTLRSSTLHGAMLTLTWKTGTIGRLPRRTQTGPHWRRRRGRRGRFACGQHQRGERDTRGCEFADHGLSPVHFATGALRSILERRVIVKEACLYSSRYAISVDRCLPLNRLPECGRGSLAEQRLVFDGKAPELPEAKPRHDVGYRHRIRRCLAQCPPRQMQAVNRIKRGRSARPCSSCDARGAPNSRYADVVAGPNSCGVAPCVPSGGLVLRGRAPRTAREILFSLREWPECRTLYARAAT